MTNNSSSYDIVEIGNELEKHIDNTRIWVDGRVIITKAFVASVKDLRFILHPKDHNPPHFHVISKQRNIDAKFSIDPIEYLSDKGGSISYDDIKKIKNFSEIRKDKYKYLLSEYKRLQG